MPAVIRLADEPGALEGRGALGRDVARRQARGRDIPIRFVFHGVEDEREERQLILRLQANHLWMPEEIHINLGPLGHHASPLVVMLASSPNRA